MHVSEVAHRYISDPAEALKLNQHVTVKVLEVDVARKRINLSIKQTQEAPARKERQQFNYKEKFNPNNKKREPEAAVQMDDALAALKRKFRN